MKIGILGGTLDPVHNGHIEIATAAMAALGLDQVALMPSGDPPHKTRATDKLDRLRMAELAADACYEYFHFPYLSFPSATALRCRPYGLLPYAFADSSSSSFVIQP